ncbi:glycoside hydrolase superfamily [Xylogone sp. PMI_703]|nr:glycoside hydrolase superfamily [Xylogone sp. PMI_703]
MADVEEPLDPTWDDLDWAIGQCFMVGFVGTEVTPQIRTLIEDHHIGTIMLTAKNLKTAQETAELVQELQTIARKAGHPVPLLIALDQEHGGVNSLFDEDYISQFPSAMGIAATGNVDLAYEIASATAKEVSAVGVNLILGPVLDVLTNARYQPLGVRATSDDPQEVSQYGIATIKGYKDVGLATCGKHFPSYGNLDFLGSSLDMPIITQTLEQLSLSALVPFRNAIREGLDSMMLCDFIMDFVMLINTVGMNVMHACLSDQVVDDLLRQELGFNGVVISECLEMEALSHDIGVRGGTVMAVEAGCDLVMLCRSFAVQKEAISGLKLGIENDMISRERIMKSLRRVLHLKSKCTDWNRALNPPGISQLSLLQPSHFNLSTRAYDGSITIVRDKGHLLPLSNTLHQEEELLLLTPLVKPLPASLAMKGSEHDKWVHRSSTPRSTIMSGEGVFRELGRSLARQRHGKLLHTSYTANGVRPVHENLINRAAAIILVTADANRNLYQNGFTKHVAMMCSMLSAGGKKKSLIVVSVSSPYDFAMDKSIGTYVCTFDFTETAMKALVRALFGEFVPQGTLPGTLRKSRKVQKSRQNWLVENWDRDRDSRGLQELIKAIEKTVTPGDYSALTGATASTFELAPALADTNEKIEEAHYVVRNSSTNAVYGFCTTYSYRGTGMIGAIFVDPAKRNLSIGHSLHQRATRGLVQKREVNKLQLGTGLPAVYLGIPMSDMAEGARLKRWFSANGWDGLSSRFLYTLTIRNLDEWIAPDGLLQNIQRASFAFDLIHGRENAEAVIDHVSSHAGPEMLELYRLALEDPKSCGIVRAKSPVDGSLVGTVIICRPGAHLSTYIPALSSAGKSVGGILGPVIPSSAQSSVVLQGLALLGIRQNKAHHSTTCVLNWVSGEERDILQGMGFEVLEAFEELSCATAMWRDVNSG